MPCVIIIGIGSDIGYEVALRFKSKGWKVYGTYLSYQKRLDKFSNVFFCDLLDEQLIKNFHSNLEKEKKVWDLIIIASGTMEPIGNFFECDNALWEKNIQINAMGPLRIIKSLSPLRNKIANPTVIFFSGAGTNGPAKNYSAYSSSKMFLIKICELLDDENKDIKFISIGPGIVMTKIHEQTLNAATRSGDNYYKVLSLNNNSNNIKTTDHQEIFDFILWCHEQEKSVVGGRNFSLVHDEWRKGGIDLIVRLKQDHNFYKMRRFGNEIKFYGDIN